MEPLFLLTSLLQAQFSFWLNTFSPTNSLVDDPMWRVYIAFLPTVVRNDEAGIDAINELSNFTTCFWVRIGGLLSPKKTTNNPSWAPSEIESRHVLKLEIHLKTPMILGYLCWVSLCEPFVANDLGVSSLDLLVGLAKWLKGRRRFTVGGLKGCREI